MSHRTLLYSFPIASSAVALLMLLASPVTAGPALPRPVVPDTAWADTQRPAALAAATGHGRFAAEASALLAVGWNEYYAFPDFDMVGGEVIAFDGPSRSWRRTSLASYLSPHPFTMPIFALAALNRPGEALWEARPWNSAVCLRPERCMVAVTQGGFDTVRWVEVDGRNGRLATNGFDVPAAVGTVAWLDADTLLVASSAGASGGASGYPMSVRLWHRGEPLAAARTIYRATGANVVATFSVEAGSARLGTIIEQKGGVDTVSTTLVAADGRLLPIPLPAGVAVGGVVGNTLLLSLDDTLTWVTRRWPGGSVLALDLAALQRGDPPAPTAVFVAGTGRSLLNGQIGRNLTVTRDAAYLAVLEGGARAIYRARHDHGRWTTTRVLGGSGQVANLLAADASGTAALASLESPIAVPVLYRIDGARPAVVRAGHTFFNARGLAVTRHAARSADGTRVGYWLAGPAHASGPVPTIVYGYGASNIPMLPIYMGDFGRLWLARGGAIAFAQVRGGGESGAEWFRAGDGLNQGRATDDFIAVGDHLVATGRSSPMMLGAYGHSSGGWLVTSAAVRRPDLFGAVVARDAAVWPEADAGALASPLMVEDLARFATPAGKVMADAYWPARAFDAKRGCPQLMFVSWRGDQRVPVVESRALAARMRAAGCPVLLFENDGGDHGVQTPETMGVIWGYFDARLRRQATSGLTDGAPLETRANDPVVRWDASWIAVR